MSPEGWATVTNHLVARAEAHRAYVVGLAPSEDDDYYWVWMDNLSDVDDFLKEAVSMRDTAVRFAGALSAS